MWRYTRDLCRLVSKLNRPDGKIVGAEVGVWKGNNPTWLLKKIPRVHLWLIDSYEEEPLVSVDFKGSAFSSIFDPALTQNISENHVKVVSWYDNEMGYSHRMVDLAVMIGRKL